MASIYDDIAFGPRNMGLSEDEVARRVDQSLALLQIEHLRGKTALKVSGGEKRMAALATVLAMEPAVMLFDEPTAFLDPRARRNLINVLKALPHTKLIATHDLTFAEEAALTAEALGNEVTRLYDVGVAGLHRLLSHTDDVMTASAIVAIAGMEGALASVIGGLADCPVIAVPTSIGYGASFGGLSALLSMLNSCASGVSVVNIDNGFGAAYLASMINHIGVK